MELIEKYLYAIGKRLPLKQRKDIVDELRSVIMDNLDDIKQNEEATQNEITQVLLDMGSPYEVAKRYKTNQNWIIGPEMYDTYITIIKIVCAVVFGAYLISIVVSLFTQIGNSFGEMLWHIFVELSDIIPGLFTAIGIVTVIFAIIERTAKKPLEIDFGDELKWHPTKLEPVPKKEEVVKPIESILGLVFTIFVIILFNFYRDRIGFYYIPSWSESWVMVKIFNPKALSTYIPLWSIAWALSIGLYGWLLSTGKHNIATRIYEMFIAALNIGILFYMAKGPNLLEFNKLGSDFIDLQPIVDFFTNNQSTIFYVLAILSILGLLTNIGKLIYKQIKEM